MKLNYFNSTNQTLQVNRLHCENINFFRVFLFLESSMVIGLQIPVIKLFFTSRILRKSPVNNILLSLSITDLTTGIALIIHCLFKIYGCKSTLIAYSLACLHYVLSNICLFSAVGHLLLFSTEHVISIFYALRYNDIVTSRRIRLVILFIYIFSTALPVTEVTLILKMKSVLRNRKYIAAIFMALILACICMMCVQYFLLFRKLHIMLRKTRTIGSKSVYRKWKTILVYILMLTSFILLTLPYYIIKILITFQMNVSGNGVTSQVFLVMRYLVSICNPIIYSLTKKDFRKVIRKKKKNNLELETLFHNIKTNNPKISSE